MWVLTSDTNPTFEVEITSSVEEMGLGNVVGMIPGRRSDEIVLFSAHYDHIGIQPPQNGDSIANGANDDASGTTAVIMLARYFKELDLIAQFPEQLAIHLRLEVPGVPVGSSHGDGRSFAGTFDEFLGLAATCGDDETKCDQWDGEPR